MSQKGLLRKYLYKDAFDPNLPRLNVLVPCPIFHIWGVEAGIIYPLIPYLKRTSVFPNYIGDILSTLKAIEKYKCNLMVGNPHHFYDLLEFPDRQNYDISSLKVCFTGGSAIQADLYNNLKKVLDTNIIMKGFGNFFVSLTIFLIFY